MEFSAASVKRDEIMNFHHRPEGHNVIQEEKIVARIKKAVTFRLILKGQNNSVGWKI